MSMNNMNTNDNHDNNDNYNDYVNHNVEDYDNRPTTSSRPSHHVVRGRTLYRRSHRNYDLHRLNTRPRQQFNSQSQSQYRSNRNYDDIDRDVPRNIQAQRNNYENFLRIRAAISIDQLRPRTSAELCEETNLSPMIVRDQLKAMMTVGIVIQNRISQHEAWTYSIVKWQGP
jgi:hypothetical protein